MVSRIKVLSTATVLFLTPVKFGCSVEVPAFWKSPIDIMLVVMIASLDEKLPSLSTALIR